MPDLITSLAGIMRAEVDMLDSIAQNNANVNTVGYRSEKTALSGRNFLNSVQTGNGIPSTIKKISDHNGSLSVTQNNFDLAIMGEGWFGVQGPDGAIMLTRNGHFHVNKDGVLVNSNDYAVVGEGGKIVGFSEDTVVDAKGVISFSDSVEDKFKIFTVANGTDITAVAPGLYSTEGELSESKTFKITQGALESSNVDVAADMVRLMETTRHIETLQRAMTSYDKILNVGINEIGK